MPSKLEVEKLSSKEIEFGSSIIEVSHTRINGRDMISFAKFYKSKEGEKKFPKSFAIPIEVREELIAAIKAVAKE